MSSLMPWISSRSVSWMGRKGLSVSLYLPLFSVVSSTLAKSSRPRTLKCMKMTPIDPVSVPGSA